MIDCLRLTPVRTAALALLGGLGLLYVLLIGQTMPVLALLGVAVVALAVVGANQLANAVADRLGSEQLPWVMYGAVTSVGVLGLVSLAEIGAVFSATDQGRASGIPTAVLVATGLAGLGAVLAVLVTGVAILVRLTRAVPPRQA